MPTPPKPVIVLANERKSHRTKAELEGRKQAEDALATGVSIKERPEVKNNPIAHKEFVRINKLLKNIGKNDAIYEPVINRYALIQAECVMFDKRREELYRLIYDLEAEYQRITDDIKPADKADYLLEYSKHMAKLSATMIDLDKQVQAKRKMLLDIEKENIMTVASALRSIPKKPKDEADDDPMAGLLAARGRA